MSSKPRLNVILLLYLIFSAFGLLTIIILALHPPAPSSDILLRKSVVGTIFILICIFGSLAALFPRQCTMLFSSKQNKSFISHITSSNSRIKGHHLDCEKFSSHVIKINRHVLCAACTGLFLGAATAISGAVIYFFAGYEIRQFDLFAIAIGIVLIILGFVQFRFRGFIRLTLNALFVFGALLILVGIDALTKNLFVDFYLNSLIIVLILTRILLSEWDHTRICCFCTLDCEFKKNSQ